MLPESTDQPVVSEPALAMGAAHFARPSDDPGLWVKSAPPAHFRRRTYRALSILIGLPAVGLVVIFTRTPLALAFFHDTAYLESGSAFRLLIESLLWTAVTGTLLFRVVRLRISYRGFPDKALTTPAIAVEVQAVTASVERETQTIYVISTEESARPPKWTLLLDRRADGAVPDTKDKMLLYSNGKRGPFLLHRDGDGRWFTGC